MGTSVQLDDSTLGSFNERVRGAALQPADDGYDERRSVWDTKTNKEPAIIVQRRGIADVITADGGLLRASEDEHPDLFWALRGESGKFGVVTSFEFDCQEEQPEALQGMFLHPIEDAMDVIRVYREVIVDAPETVVTGTGIFQIPADPEYLFELRGPGRSTDG